MYKSVRFNSIFAVFLICVSSKALANPDCGLQKLVHCAKPLSVLTDSGLTFASSKTDLDRMCPDLKHALRCVHSYTRHCMVLEEQEHFKQLFHGTSHMVTELCRNGTYQKEYLKHAPCMQKVEKQSELCLTTYTAAMSEIESRTAKQESTSEPDLVTYQKKKRAAAHDGIKSVCCAFQQYLDCSTHTMRRQCGEAAAQFSRDFLDRMSSTLIQSHCKEYGRRECGLISSSNIIESSQYVLPVLLILAYLLR